MLKAVDIYKSYGQLQVLKGVSLELLEGEVVTLIGTSGAGKSTLLQILGTLDDADQGDVYFADQKITQLSDRDKAAFRNRSLGIRIPIPSPLPEFTALENVCMPAFIQGTARSEAGQRALMLLDRLGLKDRAGHKPSQLSGGEQQRVSIARALINKPKMILADEPTGNLDTATSQELYDLIFDLARDTGLGVLIVTHNMQLSTQADRTYQIQDGKFLS